MKALRANLLSAMEEKDEDKKKEAMKAVLEAMEDEHKKEAQTEEDKKHEAENDEEKKALKATVTYLTASVNKPKIELLNKIYSASKIKEETLKQYNAEWEGMNPKQLDIAIEKVKPLVETMEYKGETEEKSPFGFSVAEGTKEFGASKTMKKIDELTDEELFRSDMYA